MTDLPPFGSIALCLCPTHSLLLSGRAAQSVPGTPESVPSQRVKAFACLVSFGLLGGGGHKEKARANRGHERAWWDQCLVFGGKIPRGRLATSTHSRCLLANQDELRGLSYRWGSTFKSGLVLTRIVRKAFAISA